ncbi:competence/damage-inducible CinA family protein [Fomitiporia mediterranea MF3/22]|uniref:competence/damage-inducible CinA family protein n=1 Tax=Fomitiporia mediterranea (strain MF3/22) TaxID=694068 RepID=UPI0004407441|nr:competence/damage-inducible CinA family protein [Fomitiporia mediterranea MF3/22]EJD01894.1 competence/damage-inducible CinA family protein [Fomitiporia mediterranea MF3/22]
MNTESTSSSLFPPAPLRPLLTTIAALLTERKQTVAVAETAAGGLISASLLSIPGASVYYRGGLTLYTLPSRIAYAGWTEESLKGYAGPTPEIVAGLAKNAREKLDATYAIGESGTAGPTGGTTRNRTPGYVALAIASADGTVTREVETGTAERDVNMIKFAEAALKLFLEVVQGEVKVEKASL